MVTCTFTPKFCRVCSSLRAVARSWVSESPPDFFPFFSRLNGGTWYSFGKASCCMRILSSTAAASVSTSAALSFSFFFGLLFSGVGRTVSFFAGFSSVGKRSGSPAASSHPSCSSKSGWARLITNSSAGASKTASRDFSRGAGSVVLSSRSRDTAGSGDIPSTVSSWTSGDFLPSDRVVAKETPDIFCRLREDFRGRSSSRRCLFSCIRSSRRITEVSWRCLAPSYIFRLLFPNGLRRDRSVIRIAQITASTMRTT